MRKAIHTDQAPAAIGPYSQGIYVDNLVFTAGQIGLDPATGRLVGDTIGQQTHQVMRNIGAILQAVGVDMNDIVKTTIYLTDLANFAEVNKIYSTYFTQTPPARSTIQVSALPLGALIEIEAIARSER